MKRRNNKKGFTLAELLIVVAIIAVLTAIAIPVFSGQLVKAKEGADMANVRAAYAEAVTAYLSDGTDYPTSYNGTTLNFPEKLTVWSASGDVLSIKYEGVKAGTLQLPGGSGGATS
jgi:prepilin-type N-terminal cleavage/methylation domain-containing protein